jgi:nucleoid DNA-binding protein
MAKAKPKAKKAKKAMTKSAFVAHLATATELEKKQVVAVLDAILETVTSELKSTGSFVLPGIAKLKRQYVEAKKGGIKAINRLNGQEYITKDKPAHYKVKLNPIKAFKASLL